MIALGQTYFHKFLEDCDSRSLIQYRNALEGLLSRSIGADYELEEADDAREETMARWSKGYFRAEELKLRFPRILFVFHSTSDHNERWIADVFFTRVPHIKGIYSNRSVNHSLPGSIEKELSRRLVGAQAADVFVCRQDESFVGTMSGLYVHQKMQRLAPLRNLAEDSKYTPQGSDLKELLQGLSGLSVGTVGSAPIELLSSGKAIRDFLEDYDSQVVTSLGKEKLQTLLQPVGISAKQWLDAGRRSLLGRLRSGR
jgi:hypothetical protein